MQNLHNSSLHTTCTPSLHFFTVVNMFNTHKTNVLNIDLCHGERAAD